jgi:hypothetical protein
MTRSRIFLIPLVALAAWVLPASGASAASCTGSPHDAANPVAGNNNEFDVKCDTAISGGGFAIRVNRGGTVAPNAQVSGGSGSLSCSFVNNPPGSPFDGSVRCAGSLSAGATAAVFASLGPNACGPPTFAGDLTVAFGSGATFGPSPLAPYPCGGGGGGGGGHCSTVRPGHSCDPGGVFQGLVKKPARSATIHKARRGLKFKERFGVKGKATVTIEVKGKVYGKTKVKLKNGKVTKLVAKLSRKGARKLKGKRRKARIHVEVAPSASEGFTTHGRQYFKLKLKP